MVEGRDDDSDRHRPAIARGARGGRARGTGKTEQAVEGPLHPPQLLEHTPAAGAEDVAQALRMPFGGGCLGIALLPHDFELASELGAFLP